MQNSDICSNSFPKPSYKSPRMNTPLLMSFVKFRVPGHGGSWRHQSAPKKILLCLTVAVAFIGVLSSVSVAQQFTNVSTEAGIIALRTRTWGNPIWGDITGDGKLDL